MSLKTQLEDWVFCAVYWTSKLLGWIPAYRGSSKALIQLLRKRRSVWKCCWIWNVWCRRYVQSATLDKIIGANFRNHLKNVQYGKSSISRSDQFSTSIDKIIILGRTMNARLSCSFEIFMKLPNIQRSKS